MGVVRRVVVSHGVTYREGVDGRGEVVSHGVTYREGVDVVVSQGVTDLVYSRSQHCTTDEQVVT